MPQPNHPDLVGFVQLIDEALRQGQQESNRLRAYIQECRQLGVEFLPLDINRSGRVCAIEEGQSIRIGFSLLAPEGDAFITELLNERQERGAFQSFQDFCERIDLNKLPDGFLTRAIQVGGFDSLEPSRARLFGGQDIVLHAIQQAAQERAAGQFNLFAALMPTSAGVSIPIALPPVEEWTEAEVIAQEKAAIGFSLLEYLAEPEEPDDEQELPVEESAPELIEPPQPDAEADVTIQATPSFNSVSPEPVPSEPLPLVKSEEPPNASLFLQLPSAITESTLLQLRDLLKQFPGPSRVILEFFDTYAQKIWVRAHADYAVQITPELIQGVEGLLGAQTTRVEPVGSIMA